MAARMTAAINATALQPFTDMIVAAEIRISTNISISVGELALLLISARCSLLSTMKGGAMTVLALDLFRVSFDTEAV